MSGHMSQIINVLTFDNPTINFCLDKAAMVENDVEDLIVGGSGDTAHPFSSSNSQKRQIDGSINNFDRIINFRAQ